MTENLLKLLVIAVVIGILAKSLLYALDLQETSDQEKDNFVKDEASSLVSSIKRFSEENKKFPLAWTTADKINIKELVKGGFLDREPRNAKEIFIGRGNNIDDKIWACFLPVSKHERADIIKLRNIAPGDKLPDDGMPKYCENKPNWQSSFCYECVSE